MLIMTTANRPFDRICLDVVEPLPSTPSNNMFILTIQDELSRYALAVALPRTDTSIVAQAFVEFFCVYIRNPDLHIN
jgi:hypothetical protein